MKSTRKIVLTLLIALAATGLKSQATTIQLELYNSYPLLDSDALTPLAGDSAAGDLVQVILAGANGVIDAPSLVGSPGGDDTLLFTTHLGAGIPSPDTGLLDAFPLNYDSSLVGSNIYVRFWNGTTVAGATYYGNSLFPLVLPAGDFFNQSQLDFVPLETSPHVTDHPFSMSAVPEPSDIFLIGLLGMAAWLWRKHMRQGGSACEKTTASL